MLYALWLKLLVVIQGLGAASGIIFYNQQIFTVSDDKTSIFTYNLKNGSQEEIELKTSINGQKITKKNKLDFESMILVDDQLICLGSGSKSSRNEMNVYDLKEKSSQFYDLTSLYEVIRQRISLKEEDFNIEGFIFYNGETYLFNRGNGKNKLNGIIRFKGLPHIANLGTIEWIKMDLPLVNGHQTTFSDAILVENQIIYTATVEEDSSVEADGTVKESIIGAIDLASFTLKNHQVIATNQKIEGITLRKKTLSSYYFLVCEDNDDDSNEAKIYELKVAKDLSRLK